MGHQRPPPSPQKPVQNEHNAFYKPQLFLQLSFGVSWSDRRPPQTHTISYASKNLKSAGDTGPPPCQQPSSHQHRRHSSSQLQHREDRPRRRHRNTSRSRAVLPISLPDRSRLAVSRGAANDRGCSAPPSIHDSVWDGEEEGPSATLFSRPARISRNPPSIWKDLPATPSKFRLGEDGLPWSTSTPPYYAVDNDTKENKSRFANIPTVLPIVPPSPANRSHREDPLRVKELESLSMAMVTVDNGFENQWWNQGQRQSFVWTPSKSDEDDVHDFPPDDAPPNDTRPMNMDDAALLSAIDSYNPTSSDDYISDLISPLSDAGPDLRLSPDFISPISLQRSGSILSDELWMGR
ncbi:hypothetical protein GGS21DRAFT_518323 [Xylaria nigripes]|nr:hypothetical protein GGS21DRAFT_518323 [Xylaria nigripes]